MPESLWPLDDSRSITEVIFLLELELLEELPELLGFLLDELPSVRLEELSLRPELGLSSFFSKKWSRFRFLLSFFSIRRLSSSLKLLLISFSRLELDELFDLEDELLPETEPELFVLLPELPDSSGSLSPSGIISILAGFFRFKVAASADEIGVILTEGLKSEYLELLEDFIEELVELLGDAELDELLGLVFKGFISKCWSLDLLLVLVENRTPSGVRLLWFGPPSPEGGGFVTLRPPKGGGLPPEGVAPDLGSGAGGGCSLLLAWLGVILVLLTPGINAASWGRLAFKWAPLLVVEVWSI